MVSVAEACGICVVVMFCFQTVEHLPLIHAGYDAANVRLRCWGRSDGPDVDRCWSELGHPGV